MTLQRGDLAHENLGDLKIIAEPRRAMAADLRKKKPTFHEFPPEDLRRISKQHQQVREK